MGGALGTPCPEIKAPLPVADVVVAAVVLRPDVPHDDAVLVEPRLTAGIGRHQVGTSETVE